MLYAVLRFLFLIPALFVVLAFVLPGAILAAVFYLLSAIFDDRRPRYYR